MPNATAPPNHATPDAEWLLRSLCALLLAGRAWACWNGDMPLRALLWDETLLGDLIPKLTGIDWGTWVSSPAIDSAIDRAIQAQGWIFLFLAAAALAPVRRPAFGLVYLFAALDLLLIAGLNHLDSGGAIGGLLGHASQFCLPLVLYLVVFANGWNSTTGTVATVALALTFAGHGLFAIGLPAQAPWLNHPHPGEFTEMLMLSLRISSESVATKMLLAAGVLDLLAATLIIFTRGRPRAAALIFMIAWGALTALARPWAYFELAAAADSLNRWLPEVLIRTPHWGLPLCLLLAQRQGRAKSSPA